MALAGVLALGLGSAAYAVECATDAVPASTLLFPFVTYDYAAGPIGSDQSSGQTTLFAITNVSSDAVIVHITLWTDYSVAILDFNLTLTGYDVQTINIRDILRDGVLPSGDTGANEWWDGTAPDNAGGTPFDDGPYSTFNQLWSGALNPYFGVAGLTDPLPTGFAQGIDCEPGTGPGQWISSPINYREDPNDDGDLSDSGIIPPDFLEVIKGHLEVSQVGTVGYRNCNWTDDEVFPNGTWFTNQDPRFAWMYVTADAVGACNKDLPDSDAPAYFGSAVGVLTRNTLMGDVIYLDSGNGFSEADNAVHLEAVAGTAVSWVPSFYFRYWNGVTLNTNQREPLPTAWAFRYAWRPAIDVNTWVRAWKGGSLDSRINDLKETETGGAITGASPAALYANTCIPYTYYAWDEDEQVNSVRPGFVPPWSGSDDPDPEPVPNLLPLETQEVPISEFFIVKNAADPQRASGWVMFIWPRSNWDGLNPVDLDWYQTWMGVKYGYGNYSAGLSGAVMANYNCDQTQVLPQLGIGLYGP
jgi:hypothetical protein